MKKGIRILGIDDGPFKKNVDKETILTGVLIKPDGYIEGILLRTIAVDGTDVNEKILSMVNGRFLREINIIMTNGITFGGFNVMDIEKINNNTGIPVISIIRKKPDIDSIKSALEKHFIDHDYRFNIINKNLPVLVTVNGRNLYINHAGIDYDSAVLVIKKTLKMGNIPEPVRMAHLIATAIKTGESHGRP
ncbi:MULTISPECIES: DUF99 family protein [Acidiplasma]|uniref:UPF0215 protein AOG55_08175 n=3 Tax=Acidiplasma TaxID=507753 RepID=A0A0Q0RI48_9ARCH|nr:MULTISPECIES: DUF99 family protein [Acidiplasma]KPV45846.1 hypothetical protein SE19_08085 [Acidiplasma aeolicum]KQB33716.1 hypothetical protein AOG54_06625 [Acidiplasma aeolicum]KQB35017.1 hypothetical protein AOG55_08175 [Acidiplasma cupricumulans]